MAFYDGIPCPVCEKVFSPDDDIVVCPECGTPHHRACWAKEKHCVHETKHSEGYQFERPVTATAADGAPAAPQQPLYSGQAQCPGCGFVHDSSCAFCPQCGLRSQMASVSPPPQALPCFPINPMQTAFVPEGTTIEGESVQDVVQAVGPNAERYLNVFVKQEKTHHKAGWNWGAFFFGGYWLLNRKCYKTGFLALLLQLALVLPFSIWMAPEMNAYYDLVSNASSITAQLEGQMMQILNTMAPKLLLMIGVLAVVQGIWALFGDFIYKRHILRIVREERAAYETAKLTPPPIYDNIPVQAHDIYYMMLTKRGGLNPIAIMGGFLFYYFAGNLVGMLLSL